MQSDKLKRILEQIQQGSLSIDDAMREFKNFPYNDIGDAKLDTHRAIRNGFPEVIFCKGKTDEQIVSIFHALSQASDLVIGTLALPTTFEKVKKEIPQAIFHEKARIIQVGDSPQPKTEKIITVVTGGTSDIPVAEEAAVTAETMGNKVVRVYDIGVAGIHRMLDNKSILDSSNVIIAVAGMEGALATVVSGLVACPVIGVPTSVGYGSSFEGLSALLSMLNSCAPGIAVVNIDNGFGAGYIASVINLQGTTK